MPRRKKFNAVEMQRRIQLNRLEAMMRSGPTPCGPRPWLPESKIPESAITTVVVCGTRDFEKYGLFKRKMEKYTFWFDAVEVVVGGEGTRIERSGEWMWIGADAYANKWAEYHWWRRKIFWADWRKHGKAAGPLRNAAMARYAAERGGYCVAFWDRRSPGTQSMIREFLKLNPRKRLRVVEYDP